MIVGAGPAGFAAALTAKSKNLRCVTLEQESLGGAVFQYPRGKLVMTAPATVPLLGKVNFRQTSKEALLEFWQDAERKTGVKINYRERVEDIAREADGFLVKTNRATYARRATCCWPSAAAARPASSACRARSCPKVVYRLIDPEQYAGQKVLVVGGGDSALEAAASIAESGGSGRAVVPRCGVRSCQGAQPRARAACASARPAARADEVKRQTDRARSRWPRRAGAR